MKLREIQQPATFDGMIFCPGCQCSHGINWKRSEGPRWTFNGDFERPTFEPSLLVQGVKRCHSYVRAGNIEFLTDCSHELAGKTVPLDDF